MFRSPPAPTLSALTVLAMAAMPLPALAQASGTVDLGSSALQLFLSLLLVFALLGGSLWALKRLSVPRGAAGGLMKVVAATAVGTRERVVVLEVGSTWLVLGVAPGRVSALAEVPRQPLPQGPASAGSEAPAWLRQLVGRRDAR
jgi:flagellar protein FliO/FliZ